MGIRRKIPEVILTIKQKMILKQFRRVFKEIQTPDTVFTKLWLIDTIKRTTNELYALFPDKDFGELSCTCFDSNMRSTTDYGEGVFYVDISFHDKYTKIPWLICRFYKKKAKVRFYISS
jgi:hypothetical protein